MSVANDISVPQLKDEVAIVTSIDAGSQVVPPPVRAVCPRAVRALHTLHTQQTWAALGLTHLCCEQRLVSGGQEMSLEGRLSDYCTVTSHVIYLVVRFPGISHMMPSQANDTEEIEIEPAPSSAVMDDPERPSNRRIFLRGTVTIPVPERDVHRVVHSLLGSQSQLNEIVSSITHNQSRQHWTRDRRVQAGAVRARGQRGRQAPGRRVPAARVARARPRNSVNVSFEGSEWQSMRVWPQSIDFRASMGDDFLYDSSFGNNGSEGFRLHYSSSAQRVISRTQSQDEESAAGQDAFLSSLFQCDDDGNHELDESYLSAEPTFLAEEEISAVEEPAEDTQTDVFDQTNVLDSFNYHHRVIRSMISGDWVGTGAEHYDVQRVRRDDELPLRRMAGKRKYAEMCSGSPVPRRSAPRSRNMAPGMPLPPGIRASGSDESGCPLRSMESVLGSERDNFNVRDDADGGESLPSLHSPNISITLSSSQPGAFPDTAEASSPLAGPRSCIISPSTVCHFELATNRRDLGVAAASRGGQGQSMDAMSAGRDLRDCEIQAHPQCGVQQAAKASGDPLAATEVIEMDSGMASLSLDSMAGARDVPSMRHVIDASKCGHAVYKTHPEPLVAEATAGVPLDADSPGSVWSQRNSTEPIAKPVNKNQCCSIM
jgi:hypothetical protein